MKMAELKNNREYLFFFEASLSNPNGDPDQENKPRMDYETNTVLVSNGRRNRDIRDFLKEKGFKIFVDMLNENKVPMDVMFKAIVSEYLENEEKIEKMKTILENKDIKWELKTNDFKTEYESKNKNDKGFTRFNNELTTQIIKDALVDIRLFGSAMAVKNLTRTYTGPIQTSWGYSLHPVELVKSNSITSMMNEDNSTFGKTYQIYYGLISHYGTVNKFSAKKTGMSEEDLIIFRKALVQSMMNNQTSSKKGQTPLVYIEICYKKDFDGYLGDLRRFVKVNYDESKPIRKMEDLTTDFTGFEGIIKEMDKYIEKIIIWKHPILKSADKFSLNIAESIKTEEVDLLENIESEK